MGQKKNKIYDILGYSIGRSLSSSGALFYFFVLGRLVSQEELGSQASLWGAAFFASILLNWGGDIVILKEAERKINAKAVLVKELMKTSIRSIVFCVSYLVFSRFYFQPWETSIFISLAMIMSLISLLDAYHRVHGRFILSALMSPGLLGWGLGCTIWIESYSGTSFVRYGLVVTGIMIISFSAFFKIKGFDRIDYEPVRLKRNKIAASQMLNSLQGWGLIALLPIFLIPSHIAIYAILQRFCQIPSLVTQGLAGVFSKYYIDNYRKGNYKKILEDRNNYIIVGFIFTLVVAISGVMVTPLIMKVYNTSSKDAVALSALLFGAQLIGTLSGGSTMINNLTGKEGAALSIFVISITAMFLCIMLLAKDHGILAIGMGMLVFSLINTTLNRYVVAKNLKIKKQS